MDYNIIVNYPKWINYNNINETRGGDTMSEKAMCREPVNSTSVNNAERLYNNLSESDKTLINSLLNIAFALLQGVQNAAEKRTVSGN